MTLELYLAYLLACFLITVIPGPTVTVIVANSLTHGTRAGLLNVAGTQIGLGLMMATLVVGLSTIIATMGWWFDWLRLAGAAYLIWLGWKLIRSSGDMATAKAPVPRGGFVLQGLLVILSNPKGLLWFGAFIPQFVDPKGNYVAQIILLGVTAMATALVSDGAYAILVGRAGSALSKRRVRLVSRIGGELPNRWGSLAGVHSRSMKHRLCVAPMMDVTDRHCRYFLRQISSSAFLYTEMITTGALIHGDVEHHLAFSKEEHPVALQLGGSEPDELAKCAKLGEQYGYDEINLNIGCPSERVQKGAFGACLMAEPDLVARCVASIRESVGIPVTVKHRTGINSIEDYGFLRDFVGTVAKAGCRTFIVHARNAILKGLSPKENREVPPLKYQYVYRLKQDFPDLEIVINGGITSLKHAHPVDGVMIGRTAVNDPWVLADPGKTRAQIVRTMVEYARKQDFLRHVTRHLLGLYHGMPRARRWRQMLSDSQALKKNDPELLLDALDEVESEESRIGA